MYIAVQALSEDESGLDAMSADEDLQQALLQLLHGRMDLLLRGRAAVLLASLDPGGTDLFAQVSPAFCSSIPQCANFQDVAGA